jgi:diguanylate cyclase (GGDEF)-like protein
MKAVNIFSNLLHKYTITLAVWSLLVAGSLAWNLQQEASETMSMAVATARTNINKDISFRKWVATHGGVYVMPSKDTPPNSYLRVPERDVVTTTGKALTLINPAYALREVQKIYTNDFGIKSHITSLKLLNPLNAADDWEVGALKFFEQGSKEVLEVTQIDGQPHLRLMKPLVAEAECLKCHAQQGYKLGDIRGGISADVPLTTYKKDERKRCAVQELSHSLIWLIGLIGLGVSYRRESYFDNIRKQMEEQVRQLAFYDMLTKLPNRRLLNDRLVQNLAASKRSGCYGALMFLDLDNFKPLNDTYGHMAGDLLLIEVANRLKSCMREMDTVARYGGDEFVVILRELNEDKTESTLQANVVANKILTILSAPYRLTIKHGEQTETRVEHHCTVSMGVVVFVDHKGSADDILKWADGAMYQAKEGGRNSIKFYDAND